MSIRSMQSWARHAAAFALVLTAATPPALRAQSLRVRLIEEGSRQPLVGVLVSALDANNAIGATVLSSADGIATVRVSGSGPHRLLVRRIGFAPVTTEPVAASAESGGTLDILVPEQRIDLGAVRVTAAQSCTNQIESPSAGAKAAWTEVRTALEASILTRDQRLVTTNALTVAHQLRADGTVELVDTTSRGRSGERPFVAAAPAILERDGYFKRHDDGSEQFYAPDERVLLSTGFTRLHCISRMPEVQHDSTGSQVVLAFVPRDRGSIPEIRGYIRIDSATSELRRIDFAYERLVLPAPADSLGGSVEFKHLASGAWIVSAWTLRIPRWRMVDRITNYVLLDGYLEVGGSASVTRDLALPAANALRTIVGLVFDSVAHHPLAGAHVHLPEVARETTADDRGAFRFDSLKAGTFTLWADHPAIDALGLFSLGGRVDVTPQVTTEVTLAIPSFATLWRRACGNAALPLHGEGFIYGQVVAGAPSAAASGASVEASWVSAVGLKNASMSQSITRKTTQTDSAGTYALCGIPTALPVSLAATHVEDRTVPLSIDMGAAGIVRRDLALTLPIHATIQSAKILRLVGGASGPVPFAWVSIDGGPPQIADEKGELKFHAGQSKKFEASIKRIGYAPWVGTLEFSDSAQVLSVFLSRAAQSLGTITVTGARIKSPLELSGFYDRWLMRQKGLLSAVFIGPEELEFRHPDRITNMLRGLNGVMLKKSCEGEQVAFSYNGTCQMAVVVDGQQQCPAMGCSADKIAPIHGSGCGQSSGVLNANTAVLIDMLVSATEVSAIEVYNRGGNMPISMQVDDQKCGVIAIWTGSRRP